MAKELAVLTINRVARTCAEGVSEWPGMSLCISILIIAMPFPNFSKVDHSTPVSKSTVFKIIIDVLDQHVQKLF